MKKISIVNPTYNEEENIYLLYLKIKSIISKYSNYDFEILVIDNASTDKTIDILRAIAADDKNFRVILNTRNFGHIRSPYWGILQATGDAVIYCASDFQDPPELIEKFIQEWESGYKIVLGEKISKESFWTKRIRNLYYKFLRSISRIPLTENTTGFGLYDKVVIQWLKKINDPYPYLRGLVCELGFEIKLIRFEQPKRAGGKSKNNLFTLYDMAMLGIVSHSLFPIRIAAFFGLVFGLMSIFLSLVAFLVKIILWNSFPLGSIPLIIGILLMLGINLLFIGILGEYVANILGHVRRRPIVVELERINY